SPLSSQHSPHRLRPNVRKRRRHDESKRRLSQEKHLLPLKSLRLHPQTLPQQLSSKAVLRNSFRYLRFHRLASPLAEHPALVFKNLERPQAPKLPLLPLPKRHQTSLLLRTPREIPECLMILHHYFTQVAGHYLLVIRTRDNPRTRRRLQRRMRRRRLRARKQIPAKQHQVQGSNVSQGRAKQE
ncbi:hypothetical protein LTS18_009993, partial [Coniosporium uncinatum]